jgi:hypothetical protein
MCLGPDGNGKKQTIPLTEKLCLLDCSRENRNASNESFFFPFRLSACFFLNGGSVLVNITSEACFSIF